MKVIDVHDDGDLEVVFKGVQEGLSFDEIAERVSEHHADLSDKVLKEAERFIGCTCGVFFECDVHPVSR